MTPPLLITPVASKAVAPTATLLCTVHVEQFAQLCMEFENLDGGAQTLDIIMKVRASRGGSYTTSTLSEFLGITVAGGPACVPVNVTGYVDVQFYGTASGAGLNCRWAGTLVRDV